METNRTEVQEGQRAGVKEAIEYLRAYFETHRMGIGSVIHSEWARGVFSGRQEAINVLTELHAKLTED